jgi:hypothetical protein
MRRSLVRWWTILWQHARRTVEVRMIRLDQLVTAALSGRGHVLLADSPHVAFLREFGDAPGISLAALRQTAYYRHAVNDIGQLGSFFGITDPDRLDEQARYFLDLYRAIRREGPDAVDPRYGSRGRFRSMERYPTVANVTGGPYFVIVDGHHRCAACYAAGYEVIAARLLGAAPVSLETLVQAGVVPPEAASQRRRPSSGPA